MSFARTAKAVLAATLVSLAPMVATAQAEPPVDRVPARTLERFEVGSFLESIVVRSDGTLLFVDHESGTIYSKASDEPARALVRTEAELRGLVLDLDDTLYASGRREDGTEAVFRLSATGVLEPWVEIPGARFLNGLALLRPGELLVADSFAEVVWRVDTRAGVAAPWLVHPWTATNPDLPMIPGPNGLKLYDGAVYMSNSALAIVVRVPIRDDGSAGEPRIFLDDLVIDDFAFSADGDLFGTTHIFDTVVHVDRDGERRVVAGPEDGVTGSTAAVCGVGPDDRETLYVVGDGGVFQPPPGGIVPAELVALDVGEPGLSAIGALSWVGRSEMVPSVPAFLVRCVTAPGTEDLRPVVGPSYLRYLELNQERIAFAGQVFPNAVDEGDPVARHYFLTTDTAESALRTIQASPYFASGLYATCDVSAFNALLGTLLGGVAWPERASEGR